MSIAKIATTTDMAADNIIIEGSNSGIDIGMLETPDYGADITIENSRGISSTIILTIVIVMCVVIGIVLGILAGKRSANK